MKLLFLFGDAAVGKMTVGQELVKITNLKLFHNHMSIEPILEIFGSWNTNAIKRFREVIFEEFAKSDNYGLVFTYMWAFDCKEDWEYVEHIKDIFEPYNTEFYYAELVAPQSVRIERNTSENRLKNKPSKRNIKLSANRLIEDDKTHRLESFDGESPFENYIKIDNSNLSAPKCAEIIKNKFNL